MKKILLTMLALGLVASMSACGIFSPTPFEVMVTLTDYKIELSLTEFSPTTLYKFVITNKGNMPHEFLLLPMGNTDRTHILKGVGQNELKPDAKIERFFRFERRLMPAGNYEFACHLFGHYENGMVALIKIQ